MKTYALDASAAVLFLSKGMNYERVAALVKKASNGEARLVISVVNWGEVLYSMAKSVGLNRATADLKAMSAFVESVIVDEELAEAAAARRLHPPVRLRPPFPPDWRPRAQPVRPLL